MSDLDLAFQFVDGSVSFWVGRSKSKSPHLDPAHLLNSHLVTFMNHSALRTQEALAGDTPANTAK